MLTAPREGDGWWMVDALSRKLNLDVATITRQFELFRAAGCELEEHPQRGVRMVESGVGAWRDYLEWIVGGNGAPRVVEVYQSTGSTQDVVRRIAQARGQESDGCVAIAQEQTAGRGRRGRKWVAPIGKAVTFSTGIVEREAGSLSAERIAFASAVGIARAVEEILATSGVRHDVRIKWPNDILVSGKKLAGVLVEIFNVPDAESTFRVAAVGVGLNVSVTPEDMPMDDAALRARVTSLAMLGVFVDRLYVLAALVSQLDWALRCDDLNLLMDEWRRRSALLQQTVRLQHDGREIVGQVIDLDPLAGLVVRTADGALLHLPSATTSLLS